jgi:hypothetical protein
VRHRRITTPEDEAPREAMADTRARALSYVPEALEELARLARAATSENVRVSAIKEILDRAHGRPMASPGEGTGGVQPLLVDDGYSD